MRRVRLAAAVAVLWSCAAPEEGGNAVPSPDAVFASAPVPAGLERVSALLEPALRARDSLVARLRPDSGTAAADSVFLEARGAFALAIDSLATAMWEDGAFQASLAGDSAAAARAEGWLAGRGLRLTWSEGAAYVSEETGHWLRLAGPYLTRALREFLALRDHDEAQGFTSDAALSIPWDSLGERIAAWGGFIDTHAGFGLLPEAEMWQGIYLRTYLTGLDNSRVFDDTLVGEARRSYEGFVRRHGDTRVGDLVRRYLEVLRATGGKETDEVHAFWRENGISSMIGMQPPIR